MAKSSIIIAPITLIIVGITSLVNTYCCLCSPLAAVFLGLIAGGLCVYFEKPIDAEKAGVRGGIAGAIAGVAALVGQTIGGTIMSIIIGAGKTPVACLPGLCSEGSAPTSQTSYILSSFFTSCLCGLVALAVMAGLGVLGGILWFQFAKRGKNNPPSGSSMISSI